MGHVRIGFLPHTKQWNAIVDHLASYDDDTSAVVMIADRTLDAVRKDYESLQYDESVIKAIAYLANIIVSSRQNDQISFLQDNGYRVDQELSLFTLTACAQQLIQTRDGSLEINKLACDAAVQAVMDFYQQHYDRQLSLFQINNNPFRNRGSGKEFCEIARYFFAAYTEKQIRYYIDRTAASVIDDYEKYLRFSDSLTEQSLAITEHVFEISKIMQSFAAGWFNKHALDTPPSEDSITDFLKLSFAKVREELRLEATRNE
jgi:hypothetical protein